jgi:hypothetical protein
MKHLNAIFSDIPFRFRLSLLLFVLAGALLASGPARADLLSKPNPMQGYYFGIGATGSMAGLHTDKTGWLSPFFGPGGSFHVGQGITENLALGVSLGTVYTLNSNYAAVIGHFGIELKWRFSGNLFVRPLIGFGLGDLSRRKSRLKKIIPAVTGTYSAAFGYDHFIEVRRWGSGGFAVTPIVWFGAKNGTSLTVLQGGIGVEITWWTGLPKNQLQLPLDAAYE